MSSKNPLRGHLALVLSAAIALPPLAAAQASRRCAEILGGLVVAKPRAVLPASLAGVVDLTGVPQGALHTEIRGVNASSVVLLNDAILRDTATLKELQKSSATFALRSRGGASEEAMAYLARSVSGIEVDVALPTTALGVNRAFGVPVALAGPALSYLNDARREFRGISNVRVLPEVDGGRTNADAVRTRLRAKDTRLFLLVAHNDRGTLKFADGSGISVVDVHALAAESSRLVLVLSCDTALTAAVAVDTAAVTLRPLDFMAIAASVRATHARLGQGPATMADLLSAMDGLAGGSKDSSGRTARIVAMLVAGALIAVAGSLAFWECDQTGDC